MTIPLITEAEVNQNRWDKDPQKTRHPAAMTVQPAQSVIHVHRPIPEAQAQKKRPMGNRRRKQTRVRLMTEVARRNAMRLLHPQRL